MGSSEEPLAQALREKEFVEHWLADLLGAMDEALDRETRVKLIEACGRACYARYALKQDIARDGQAGVEELIAAYRRNFEAWRDGDDLHIRYGAVSRACYCPAARARPPVPDDLHCECTRTTHQTICETALGRPLRAEIVESLRRGGQTCHIGVHLGA